MYGDTECAEYGCALDLLRDGGGYQQHSGEQDRRLRQGSEHIVRRHHGGWCVRKHDLFLSHLAGWRELYSGILYSNQEAVRSRRYDDDGHGYG